MSGVSSERKRSNTELDSDEGKRALAEAKFYKEKLIKLARAHAALLDLVSSDSSSCTGTQKNNINEDSVGVEALISNSQLSNPENEDESLGHFITQNSQSSTTSALTLLPDSQGTTFNETKDISSPDANNLHNDIPKLDRMGSIASQISAFSDLIADSGEVLTSLKELEAWFDHSANFQKGINVTDDTDTYTAQQPSIKDLTSPSERGTKSHQTHVRVGVGVLVQDSLHQNRIFAGIRKGSHGEGKLALPGGHLEMQEKWSECAAREVEEETGLKIYNIELAHVTNDPMPEENKHYITIMMMAKCVDNMARPKNLEPHKCEGWDSYSWEDLREIVVGKRPGLSLFGPLQNLVEDEPKKVMKFMGQE